MNAAESTHEAPYPAPDEKAEEVLWRAFREEGSAHAREQLFSLHYDYARGIARRLWLDRRSGDIEFQDLCQLASAGLLEALDRFDPSLDVPFTAYAARRISGSVRDGIAKASEMREQISFRNRVRSDRLRSLARADAEALRVDQAMRALTELAVGLAIGFMLDDVGLCAPAGERDRRASAYDSLVWKETIQRLLVEVGRLPERERLIIRHHYLSGLTFDQLGEVLMLSKGRISQLHQAAITLLRKRLRNAGDFKLER